MKINLIFFISISFLLFGLAYGQKSSFYGSIGINIPASQNLSLSFTDDYFEFSKMNYVEGITFKGGTSYFFLENVGLDLNISYLFSYDKSFNRNVRVTKEYSKSSNFSISPSLILQTQIEQFTPYAKFGVSINFITVDVFMNDISYPQYIYSTDYTLGINASLGLKYPIGETFSVFTDLSLSAQTMFADKVILQWKEDGVIKSYEYNLETKIDSNDIESVNYSREFPFSSFTISVGLMYDL